MPSLRRLLRYMSPYRWIVLLGILTVILPVAMELLVPRLLQNVIDDGIRRSDMHMILQNSLIMLAAAVIGAVATLGQGICRARLSQGLAFDIRNDLFNHIQSLPFARLDQLQTGGLMTRLSSDVDNVRRFSSSGLALLLRAVLMIGGSVVMIVSIDAQLSIIILACLGGAGIIITVFIRVASRLFMTVQQKLSTLNTVVQENLAGVRVVKAFVREQYEIARFAASNLDYMSENIKVGRILAVVTPTLTLLTNLGIAAVVWYGGLSVIGDRLSIGKLVAFTNYLMIGMAPLLMLGNMISMSSRAEASATRVLELFDTQPQSQASNPHRAASLKGRIVFDNVSFRYDGTDREEIDRSAVPFDRKSNLLDRVSFEVLPGQRVALLGTTGVGKTTLVNLISRFYDVTGGRILIDGIDVRDWDLTALRIQIGTVMQQPILFSGTVRENIAYGRPGASLEEVIQAARIAQAHKFIMTMPDGYDSLIEDRGANLSGGQKQRVAIARAILISPGILILDDSTSAVDLETEILIQDALDQAMAETTSLIIAQRINSVLSADQIMILDTGRIVASGTHHELMKTSQIYQEIYRSQLDSKDSSHGRVPS